MQDLTPNLRTRLNRVEHVVGFFVLLAALLLLGGFGYYIWYTAEKKGWFETKAPFFCYVESATGLSVGQPVTMMGFQVGEITEITAMEPHSGENVYVEFEIKGEFIGYMWTDSKVLLSAGDILGNRSLEVLKGNWSGTWLNSDGSEVKAIHKLEDNAITEIITKVADGEWKYVPYTETNRLYYMPIHEDPALTQRASSLVGMAESAMPSILSLTNDLQLVLTTANTAVSNLNSRIIEFESLLAEIDGIAAGFRPASSNVSLITANLTNANGGLGQWLMPTNLNLETAMTLASVRETLFQAQGAITNVTTALNGVNVAVENTDANLSDLMDKVGLSLVNLAGITSNLNVQVNSNTNILAEVSQAIRHTDEFVQGMKKFWLLRGTFKKIEKEKLKELERQRR